MSLVCPQGHTSQASDYCDTCGSPMRPAPAVPSPGHAAPGSGGSGGSAGSGDSGGSGSAGSGSAGSGAAGSSAAGSAADAPTPPAAGAQVCPNCDTPNMPDALFCEACGYDFTTGVMPRPVALTDGSYIGGVDPTRASPVLEVEPVETDESGADESDAHESDADAGAVQEAAEQEPVEQEPAAEAAGEAVASSQRDPAEVAAKDSTEDGPERGREPAAGTGAAATETAAGSPPPHAPASSPAQGPAHGPDAPAAPDSPQPSRSAGSAPAADSSGAPVPSASKRMANRPPSRVTVKDWVVEIWIDPDWYAVQESPEPCPSPGVPDIVALHDGALVGRPSSSRNVRPDIDCGTDTGASRRQALLTTDGRRWWIEDLGSSNGTYVGPASGPLPVDPITAKVEVDADDRIYVGAWTRLVVRPATDSERAGLG